ncbi:MAG: NfeD family protein [Alphaproteobacteria bacterium]|nr:NfeD family protein [Alphaproteobacteria bacterium]
MTYIQWLSLGIILIVLEFFVPGTYLIWFGFSACVVSSVVFFTTLTLTKQLLLFSVISAVFAVFGLYVYRKIMQRVKPPKNAQNLNDMAAQYVGRSFKLVQEVVDGRSKVAVGDTVWIVECPNNLKSGDLVKIIDVRDGVVLIAEKAGNK